MKARRLALRAAGFLAGACLLVSGGCSGSSTEPEQKPVDWKDLPVVPVLSGELKERFHEDVAKADQRGMRAGVFAKVGDSNTEFRTALYGLACRRARLPEGSGLRAVIRRYNRVKLPNQRALPGCHPSTSFSRRSAAVRPATVAGWSTTRPTKFADPGRFADPGMPADCPLRGTPLECEIRKIRPRYALILTGTNDVFVDRAFGLNPGADAGRRLERVVRAVRRRGVIPVLSTLPPNTSFRGAPAAIDRSNQAIAETARRQSVPLINLWRALTGPGMVNDGLADDGVHLRSAPRPRTFAGSVDFRPEALRYGANRRNLVWLQTLAALDEAAE